MKIDSSLFDKYENLKFRHSEQLFDIDWEAVRISGRCPLCGNKLHESLKFKDSIICRNKKHRFFKIKKWK
jgi:hypothetical protein